MRWFKPNLRNSLHAIFSGGPTTLPPDGEAGFGLEDIRQKMLDLTSMDSDERTIAVRRRIRYADDVQALWFVRGELMALLAREHGEAAAYEQIEMISDMFVELLPRGLRSRPSPLGRS
ncbi:MAG TPA: hypothetical protein VFE82_08905 [Ramlibacter sp.]|jgi:hypothetical protein|uniref:hypothetical protein n=1 Tax=Ramlibacter sp. TaxID=1917967 RepID=UPI002D2A3F0E|nr:hypothetical protein [Ramlibacter sp.]HZY18588.1 hypothetical protein [Ramlibacter sp.]